MDKPFTVSSSIYLNEHLHTYENKSYLQRPLYLGIKREPYEGYCEPMWLPCQDQDYRVSSHTNSGPRQIHHGVTPQGLMGMQEEALFNEGASLHGFCPNDKTNLCYEPIDLTLKKEDNFYKEGKSSTLVSFIHQPIDLSLNKEKYSNSMVKDENMNTNLYIVDLDASPPEGTNSHDTRKLVKSISGINNSDNMSHFHFKKTKFLQNFSNEDYSKEDLSFAVNSKRESSALRNMKEFDHKTIPVPYYVELDPKGVMPKIKIIQKSKLYKCKTCKEFLGGRNSVDIHINKYHLHQGFRCKHCDKKYYSCTSAFSHFMNHHQNQSITCSLCDFRASSCKEIHAHLATVHCNENAKTIACPECGTECSNGKSFKSANAYSCETCGSGFCSKFLLLRHINECHDLKAFPCPLISCHHVVNPSTVSNHMELHHKKMKHVFCHICGTSFHCLKRLGPHKFDMHLKIRKYVCQWPNCNRAFKQKKHLAVHLMIHTGEKPMSCPKCSYTCRQKNSLNYHLRKHHKEIQSQSEGEQQQENIEKTENAQLVVQVKDQKETMS